MTTKKPKIPREEDRRIKLTIEEKLELLKAVITEESFEDLFNQQLREEAEMKAYKTIYRKGFFKELIDIFKKKKEYDKFVKDYIKNKEAIRR